MDKLNQIAMKAGVSRNTVLRVLRGQNKEVWPSSIRRAEQIRGQQDNPPVAGTYPTTLWVPGEVVVDRYDITIRGDTPPGMHVIEVGLYDPANMQRLPVLDPSGALGDRILLGQIEIRF